ncbi:LPS-assembly protein LptD [Tsuneonella sp. HG249]
MLPATYGSQQASSRRPPAVLRRGAASALVLVLALCAAPVTAQDGPAPGMGTVEEPDGTPPDLSTPIPPIDPATMPATPTDARRINFEANAVAYDQESETVTATGEVVLRSEDRSVRADEVVWNRQTGQIVASGDVRFVDEEGNQLYTSRIELTDEFEAGAMEDLLLALREGGRLAAASGSRLADGTIELNRAAYTGCEVVTPEGCPREPSWRITADRVVYSPADNRVRFQGAYLEMFGARLIPLPGLAIRTDGRPVSGFLIPDIQYSRNNGLQLSGSYYLSLAPNRDLTLSGYAFTGAPPMASGQWRHLTDDGAYQVTAYGTYSRRLDPFGGAPSGDNQFRGYIFANGRFQLDPNWSVDFSARRATDRTFLRRYDISRDDRLRSMIEVERVDDDSYLTIAGYATQTMRLGANQGQVPIAIPMIDYRKRIDAPIVGGKLELQANTLAIHRPDGQDTQRAFAGAKWDLKRVTPWGQLLTLSALLRGDVYHSDENGLTATAIYRGNPGWKTRGVALAAADLEWPLVGRLFGGTQVLTPRVQVVLSPPIANLSVPNEDARAIDLEDSNLFALNRFPGYDRIEDRPRITYGFDWQLTRPNWRIDTTVGQSVRLDNRGSILPDGTGLSERVSDFVGRTEIRFKDFVKLTHRFRLDKDNFAVRRNEFDAAVGSSRTYAEVGYLRLNRDISPTIEDLRDREELRFAGRLAFARYWSVFGSGVFNLTDRFEDPSLTADGFEPIRTRLGVAYQDDCLELGATWRRDYVNQGDARKGNTFQFYFALRNLGFR